MKKKDWILIVILILFIGATIYVHRIVEAEHAGYIRIMVAGEEMGVYELSEDIEIPINNISLVRIKDGSASVTKSSCEDQSCVNQPEIKEHNEGIICLPNQLVVMVLDKEPLPLDAVAE